MLARDYEYKPLRTVSLLARINQGVEAMTQEPVVFRWRYKMDEITVA